MTGAAPPMLARALGAEWARLAPAVRDLHDVVAPRRFSGRVDVVRGTSPLARLACAVFSLPPDGLDQPLTLLIRPDGPGERWERRFGTRGFVSRQRTAGAMRTAERVGIVTAVQALRVEAGALHQSPAGCRVLGVPLPRWLGPRATARETDRGGVYRFEVDVELPFGGRLVAYSGSLVPGACPQPS